MNTYQKESLLVIIVLAAILVYSNLPQWLLCYLDMMKMPIEMKYLTLTLMG